MSRAERAIDRTLERVRAIIVWGEEHDKDRERERAKERRLAFERVLAADDLETVHRQFIAEWGELGWAKEMHLYLRRLA